VEARLAAQGSEQSCTLVGHIIYDEDEDEVHEEKEKEKEKDVKHSTPRRLAVAPDADWTGPRYFIPFAANLSEPLGPVEFGQFANDLAYEPGTADKAEYRRRCQALNSLRIIWRMELVQDEAFGALLVPTWPVNILSRDLLLDNDEPMELGISYGWGYWLADRNNASLDRDSSD
jgi:hypothetical protein